MGGGGKTSAVILRPGDVVSFTGKAWDPEAAELSWIVRYTQRHEEVEFHGDLIHWNWKVNEKDIGDQFEIHVKVSTDRAYSRHSFAGIGCDDLVIIKYKVLPQR